MKGDKCICNETMKGIEIDCHNWNAHSDHILNMLMYKWLGMPPKRTLQSLRDRLVYITASKDLVIPELLRVKSKGSYRPIELVVGIRNHAKEKEVSTGGTFLGMQHEKIHTMTG